MVWWEIVGNMRWVPKFKVGNYLGIANHLTKGVIPSSHPV
jgi:hypothetical protein